MDKLFVAILLAVFGGIVLHAPLSVGLSTLWPDASLFIKSWKEILLGVALVLALLLVARQKAWAKFNTPLFWLIGGFAALNVLLIPVFYTGAAATAAGLFINLRYLLFFILVFVALRLHPKWYKTFVKVFFAGAAVVVGFALLQTTVLPHDVLKHIGYGEATIMPFLTVDENMDYIRINSTLRGPNPLGAYAVIVLAALGALWLSGQKRFEKWQKWLIIGLGIGGAVALWASYSRSAALGLVVAIGIIAMVVFGRQIRKIAWAGLIVAALVLGGSLVALRDTPFISQVILHEDPTEGNNVNSNDGHAASLIDGFTRMVQQPFGGGIGSTGSASLLTDKPLIIENQYLFIAHETGWLGLGLFIVISYLILEKLWARRRNWLALGVFASGIGLVIVGMLLPVWVDETVALVWWGLAAMVLARPVAKKSIAAVKK